MFDGTALYEHADPRKGEHPDWGTLIFNYGRNEVRNFLLSNALFWLDKYHIDGLRVDAVASMLYLDYSRKAGRVDAQRVRRPRKPRSDRLPQGIQRAVAPAIPRRADDRRRIDRLAGVSRPTYVGGLGFSLKWNMGWMNDTLRYMRHDPIHRKYHHDELTFCLIYAFNENFVLPLSHDEVVHGKGSLLDQMPGDLWQKFANLRLLYGYMWAHPGKKLLFMGGEFGQWNEWNYDDSLQWHLLQWESHQGVQKMRGRSESPAIAASRPCTRSISTTRGFEWIDCHNWQDSVLCFIRRAKDPHDFLIVCCNFTPVSAAGSSPGRARSCAGTKKSSTAIRRTTAAAMWAIIPGYMPCIRRATAARLRL